MAKAIIENDNRSLWSEISKVRGKSKLCANIVDDAHEPDDIAKLFANNFKEVYNVVSYEQNKMDEIVVDLNSRISHNCTQGHCYNKHTTNIKQVKDAVKQLKRGKTDGDLGHTSDHIIHGTERLYTSLSMLYSCMVTHGYVPDGMLLSTIIPIPKNKKKSLSNSSNYRGIALSSILGKVLDKIILARNNEILNTSNMQFGFKSKHSTTQCTFVVQEVINYYIQRGGNVYTMFLDASKAFDRVNYVKLFQLLIRKGLCPVESRFLAFMYCHQICRVKWAKCTTEPFNVSNGVKQGGVLSPFLFGVYIDELLVKLSNQKYGCFIGNLFMGAFGYADDVSLLAPTRYALYRMLESTNQFSKEYDIKFNMDKSELLVFNHDGKYDPSASMLHNEVELFAKQHVKHVGNVVGPLKLSVDRCIHEFNGKVNMVYAYFKHLHMDGKYTLFTSYCMSLYGSQLWDYSSNECDKFYVAWRKAVRKLFGLPLRTHCILLPEIMSSLPIEVQMHKRFVQFAWKAIHSENVCVSTCASLALDGSLSSVCNSINFISYKYNISKYDLVHSNRSDIIGKIRQSVKVSHQVQVKSGAIRDFVSMRDDLRFNYNPFISHHHLHQIIDDLCCD
jgi:hypothetical protein